MKKSLAFLLLSACHVLVFAQQEPSPALKALKQLMYTYSQNSGLSFDMQLTYAPESRPAQFLDSLRGKVILNGKKSWYMIDSTESVNTGDFLITVFREDKLLFLAKPASVTLPQGTGLSGLSEAWLQSMDSLVQNNLIQLNWKDEKDQQQIVIHFPEAKEYKMLTFVIDKKTGYMKQSITVARSAQLMDEDSRREANITDEFAIITTYFQNNSKGRVSEILFDPARYFTKKGDEYIGVNEFKDYKVFLGTPGM